MLFPCDGHVLINWCSPKKRMDIGQRQRKAISTTDLRNGVYLLKVEIDGDNIRNYKRVKMR